MKIAVTYENGTVFQHFGHTEQFKVYQVEDGRVTGTEILDTNGSGHGALAGFLQDAGVEALICGGRGMGARNALAQAGVTLYAGVTGDADAAVQALLANRLAYGTEANCRHHDGGHNHTHHGDCASHDCGGHCGA